MGREGEMGGGKGGKVLRRSEEMLEREGKSWGGKTKYCEVKR